MEQTVKTLKLQVPHPDTMRVQNSDRCTDESIMGETEFVQGIPWRVFVHVDHASPTDRTRYLSVFLSCCWELQTSWIIDITAVIRVIILKTAEQKKETKMELSIRNNTPTVGFKRFVPWNDMLREQSVGNRRFSVEIDLTLDSINTLLGGLVDFSIPMRIPSSELVLRLGDRVLNVNWKILALHSAYFKKKFLMAQKGTRGPMDFLLRTEDFDDIEIFLHLIHGNSSVLNMENIERQVDLCRRFESTSGIQLCSQFLIRSKYIDWGMKLSIAVKYKLAEVENLLIRCINHLEEVKPILQWVNWASPEIRRQLLRKATKRLEKKRMLNEKTMGKRSETIEFECGLKFGEGRYSELENIDGIPFRFGVKMRESDNEHYFRLILECCLHDLLTWWLDVTCVFHLNVVHEKGTSDWTVTRTLSQFQPKAEEKVKTSPTSNGRIYFHLTAQIAVRKVQFGIFKEKFRYWKGPGKLTNVALKVGEAKFYVIKEVLATVSPYFQALFYQNFVEKRQRKVELRGIEPTHFEELLQLIYNPQRLINHETLTFLLPLADYLDVPSVLFRCDWYLRTSREFYPFQKQRLAVTYRLENTLLAYPLDFPEMSVCSSDRMQNMIYRILEGQRRIRTGDFN